MLTMKPHTGISERHSKTALLASTAAVLILVLAGVLFAAELDGPDNLAPLAAGQDLCAGETLAPGQPCLIGVKISATSSGARTATLSVSSNDGEEYVVGKGVPPTALWDVIFAN